MLVSSPLIKLSIVLLLSNEIAITSTMVTSALVYNKKYTQAHIHTH